MATYDELERLKLNIEREKTRREEIKFNRQENQAARMRLNSTKSKIKKSLQPKGFASEAGQKRFRKATSGTGSLLRALGAPVSVGRASPGKGSKYEKKYPTAGRPRGSYKYGVPIREFKRNQSQSKALIQLQNQQDAQRLTAQGYTPDQIQAILLQSQNQPIKETQLQEQIIAQNVSPNTQALLNRIHETQTKGARDNLNMQRILRERRLVNDATDLLKTPSIFGPQSSTIDIFNTNDNIMKAPNLFAANENSPNILKTGRLNLLQTAEAGNNLKFF